MITWTGFWVLQRNSTLNIYNGTSITVFHYSYLPGSGKHVLWGTIINFTFGRQNLKLWSSDQKRMCYNKCSITNHYYKTSIIVHTPLLGWSHLSAHHSNSSYLIYTTCIVDKSVHLRVRRPFRKNRAVLRILSMVAPTIGLIVMGGRKYEV